MRKLVFHPNDHAKRFILCYQALCFADAQLPRNEVRPHGEVLRKLEGIGQIANPERRDTEMTLYRCIAGGEILVTETEYRILKRFLDAFLEKVNRGLSREMDAAFEWLENLGELPEASAEMPA